MLQRKLGYSAHRITSFKIEFGGPIILKDTLKSSHINHNIDWDKGIFADCIPRCAISKLRNTKEYIWYFINAYKRLIGNYRGIKHLYISDRQKRSRYVPKYQNSQTSREKSCYMPYSWRKIVSNTVYFIFVKYHFHWQKLINDIKAQSNFKYVGTHPTLVICTNNDSIWQSYCLQKSMSKLFKFMPTYWNNLFS